MTTQVLQDFEESSKVFRLDDILPSPPWASYQLEAPAFPTRARWISEKDPVDRGCLKGLMIGFAAEAVMALGVFAAWQVWHILR
jgi:hypothetical protein